jgi:hypothetical protein
MLPNKEVMSLLDLNVDVDLALDLAAPVDLAVAANANIAAPIEAAVSSNVLSLGSESGAGAHQVVGLDQSIAGAAIAHAPQDASVDQGQAAAPAAEAGPAAPAPEVAAPGATAPEVAAPTAPVPDAAAGLVPDTGGVTDAVPAVTSGGALDGPLLNVDANVNLDGHLAAPVAGAVAANANVAAPIDASASANIASIDSTSTAVSDQTALISQHLDGVTAEATAAQNADVTQ